MTPPINSVSDHILQGIAAGDLAASPFEVVSIAKELAARRAANTPVDGVRALELADALDEFADIDEAEGGNPHVIATEREAAQQLRALSCLTSPAAEPLTVDDVERIIVETEPASQSDHGDKIWTRRMAVALAARLSHPAPSASREVTVTDEMVERAARNIAKRRGEMSSWDDLPPSVREDYLFDARSALLAALPEREG